MSVFRPVTVRLLQLPAITLSGLTSELEGKSVSAADTVEPPAAITRNRNARAKSDKTKRFVFITTCLC